MGEPNHSPPGPANPQEERTCRRCNETKVVTPESWPYRRDKQKTYAAHGTTCLVCEKKRKSEYEARRDKIAALVKDVPAVPIRGTTVDKGKQRDAVNSSRLDVAKALKAGGRVLNEYAPSVLSRVIEYAEDPESPHHIWAIELLAQRILPRKLFEELGGQAAGGGRLHDKRPMFQINVLPAQPQATEQGRLLNEGDGVRISVANPEERDE